MVNPHDSDDDDISIGSLAFLEVEKGKRQSNDNGETRRGSSSTNKRSVDSPFGGVQKLTHSIERTKTMMLTLLVLSGIFLVVAAYFVEVDEDEKEIEGETDEDYEDDGGGGSSSGAVHSAITGGIYAIQIALFLRYEYLVTRRQAIVMELAQQAKTIVDSLFPSVVRDRLLQGDSSHGNSSEIGESEDSDNTQDLEKITKKNTLANKSISEKKNTKEGKTTLSKFLDHGEGGSSPTRSGQPIAEQFPSATVLFADIAGFTEWSSARDPTQVFRLLETTYAAFDELADMLNVFKVETIGDCYMAVTGVPEADPNHHIAMSRFSYQIVRKMNEVIEELALVLGDDTRDLGIRVGMHSGPVTAGVLRGQKSRFQLFGDTVNTASRMESKGEKGRIQISQATADLLIASGKSNWIRQRSDKIVAKGKGELNTYWLDPTAVHPSTDHNRKASEDQFHSEADSTDRGKRLFPLSPVKAKKSLLTDPQATINLPTGHLIEMVTASGRNLRLLSPQRHVLQDQNSLLINRTTDLLFGYLRKVMISGCPSTSRSAKLIDHATESADLPPPVDLLADVILFPKYNPLVSAKRPHSAGDLGEAENGLRKYLTDIAVLYNSVPFHNFEHAAHVALATDKLVQKMTKSKKLHDAGLHHRSFGISSDPLAQFAIVFAALIHDVGHIGVPNSQLVEEQDRVALRYKNQSVAEQNSISIAWQLLLEPRYQHLRSCIYSTNIDRKRFRQIVINSILATDISDRMLHVQRMKRWKQAFSSDDADRKATVVLDNLLQMADVSHTMQNWQVYRQWNDCLFREMQAAYRVGRASFDPAEIWYRSELGFFDHYVIPLSKRMSESGVFGESGELFVSNAQGNRNVWEKKGEDTLASLIGKPTLWEVGNTLSKGGADEGEEMGDEDDDDDGVEFAEEVTEKITDGRAEEGPSPGLEGVEAQLGEDGADTQRLIEI